LATAIGERLPSTAEPLGEENVRFRSIRKRLGKGSLAAVSLDSMLALHLLRQVRFNFRKLLLESVQVNVGYMEHSAPS